MKKTDRFPLKVHLQIVHHHNKETLLHCLRSLVADLSATAMKYKVSVLDNASGEDLSDIQTEFAGKISFYGSNHDLGFSAGHNLLAEKEPAEYLLFLSSDIRFLPENKRNNIERFIHRADQHDQESIFGPKLLTSERIPQRFDHGRLLGAKAKLASLIGRSYWKEEIYTSEVAWVSSAAFLIKKELFSRLGGFNKRFSLPKAEQDLCRRARKAGERVLYLPSIEIVHHK
jgi:N-acetylglucosaminyl-diphospho-decaprenol L-rhamnosyltransferase